MISFRFFIHWFIWPPVFSVCVSMKLTLVFISHRAVVSAGTYHDTSEEGKFYAVVLEQTQQTTGQGHQEVNMNTP